MDAVTGGFEDGPRKGGDGALAVGAGDMDDRRQPVLRIAKERQHALYAAKREVIALRMDRRESVDYASGAHFNPPA